MGKFYKQLMAFYMLFFTESFICAATISLQVVCI